ncbi:MAG: prolyl oligopeptidase family serine peptidase [Gemmatimonadaceae bacterium]
MQAVIRVASPRPLVFAIVAAVGCSRSGSLPVPETRKVAVLDTLHGVSIPDPYRWLEDQESDEVRGWIATQERYADSVMGPSTPLRDSLRTRLAELIDAPAIGAPRKAGDFEYFTLRRKGEPVGAIYRRRAVKSPTLVSPDSQYEKVIDPLTIRGDGTTSVGVEAFSNDGKLLLYSVRDGGPDEISVRVRDLASGSDLPDSLPRALYAGISMGQDGKGIYYVHRSRQDGPRFKYHRLGTALSADSVIYGAGYGPTAFLNVFGMDGGKYRVFTIGHGWARNEVHVQNTKTGAITELTKGLNAHFSAQSIGGKVWMRTDLAAPRGRIVAVDLTKPGVEDWQTIVPEHDIVLDGFTQIDDKIYVTWIKDVSHRISVHDLQGRQTAELEVPPHASASIRGFGKGAAQLTINSFAQPSITWKLDLATGERSVWEKSAIPFDTAAVEVNQVWYTSKDGTRAPMYLLQKRGAARNPNTPVLLNGYGGFVLSLMPRFDPRAAVWVERGGIYAQATLRGGNEYGEEWHRGGMLTNKQKVFDDFIAAAQLLVDSGYTSPAHLTIRGGSNGGLLMGAALTQRPDLYRAAFVGVPDLDMVRFYTFTTHNNMPALLEYGDASRKEEFDAIVKYSPYQNVKDGTNYPAVMVQTGINDTRVPPWQARKFTARLQAATRSAEPVILYHDLRSGHAGGRAIASSVDLAVKEMEFLWSRAAQGERR